MKFTSLSKTAGMLLAVLTSFLSTAFGQFKVVGYTTSWSGSASSIQYNKVTHLNYAFLLPNSDGSVQAIENPGKLQSVVASSHAVGVKVLISVGGWMNGDPSPFVNLASNGTYRSRFINELVNFVNQYGLDGVDIDWEHPTSATGGLYATLMSELSNAMHSRGKLLTSAVVSSGGAADPLPSSVFGVVDWLNIMDYDNNNFDHSTYATAVNALNYWNGRGLPGSKTVLGVPFYSRPGWYTYAQLLSMGANPNADVWNGQGYNGITTIKSKTNLLFDRGEGGIMFWEIAQDTTDGNSLLTAIDQVVKQRQGGGGGLLQPYFMLVNKNSGKAIDLIAGNASNGAPIRQWSFDYNSNNQHWAVLPTEGGNHFKIISQVSGKCLCIAEDSTALNAATHAWDYIAGNTSHQWDLLDAGNGWYRIKNVRSGYVLDVANFSTADNATILQWNDTGTANQLFRLQPWGDYFIQAASGRYVCVANRGSTNGELVIQYDWENNPWFKWRFESVGEGNLKCSSLNALGRVLCPQYGNTVAGQNCHIWDYNPSNIGDQKVRIKPLTNGKFKFFFTHDGYSWDMPGGQTGNNVPVQQYPNNGNSWQEFTLKRAQ